jgi:Lar family restriction alleviation protein
MNEQIAAFNKKYGITPPVNKEEILPCPFCGGDVAPHKREFIDGSISYYMYCCNDDCEVNSKIDRPIDSEEEIIRLWNKREN